MVREEVGKAGERTTNESRGRRARGQASNIEEEKNNSPRVKGLREERGNGGGRKRRELRARE